MAVLVTGGAGYIGSHTCVELINSGFEVVIIDNLSNSSEKAVTLIGEITGVKPKFYKGDLLNPSDLERVFSENDIDSVIHFAGLKAVGESVEKPLFYYSNNITGSLNLLSAMLAHGCGKLVFSSSATVYGTNNPSPMKEDMPLSAINPYGRTKLMIEQIITDFCAANSGFSAVLLRYFNPIGAHESGLLGESPRGIPNNIFPYISRVAAGSLPELSVFGDDYDTPDGTGVRDYIHVTDLAKGHLKALGYAAPGCDAVNLGTGRGTSVLELISAFEKASGKAVPYRITGRRPGDIATCFADPSRAESKMGWRAAKSVQDMCKDGWNFICKNPNGI